MAARCRALIAAKCSEHGWDMRALTVQPDHIHLFVRLKPSASDAVVVKECQGMTACALRKEVPPLHRLPSLWTRSSFASTAGTVRPETIQRSRAA
jgi:putative transposase